MIMVEAECVHARKGLALPRREALRRDRPCKPWVPLGGGLTSLRSTLAAAPVLFAHAAVTETKINRKSWHTHTYTNTHTHTHTNTHTHKHTHTHTHTHTQR